jgi:ParB family chromosome partitioning protein
MAKRRKLRTPSAEDLQKIEDEFRRETSPASAMAPISQVAAEAAQVAPVVDAETRAKQARDEADAETLRASQEAGLLIQEIPLSQINPTDLVRDRLQLDEADMQELQTSIQLNGLRLPIELYELSNPVDERRYGILSGYRRFKAVHRLFALTEAKQFATIKALIRQPASVPDTFTAMVEENEVRADLSPFERGRISSMSVQMGVFSSTEEAVNVMFASASKAKRSKIRSFAVIFDELGDVLTFPEALSEKQGLRLAAALRGGGEMALRNVLADAVVEDAAQEWQVIESEVDKFESKARNETRGGRPSKKALSKMTGREVRTNGGMILRREEDNEGYIIRVRGAGVDQSLMDELMDILRRRLDGFDD